MDAIAEVHRALERAIEMATGAARHFRGDIIASVYRRWKVPAMTMRRDVLRCLLGGLAAFASPSAFARSEITVYFSPD